MAAPNVMTISAKMWGDIEQLLYHEGRVSCLVGVRPKRPPDKSRRLAVVSELEGDAEIVLAQRVEGELQLVLRGRGHAHLVGLDGRLHLLELLIFEVFDDLARRFDRDALLNREDAPD